MRSYAALFRRAQSFTCSSFYDDPKGINPEGIHGSEGSNTFQTLCTDDETGSSVEIFHESGRSCVSYTRITVENPKEQTKAAVLHNHALATTEVLFQNKNKKETACIVDRERLRCIHSNKSYPSEIIFFQSHNLEDPSLINIFKARNPGELEQRLRDAGHTILKRNNS